jgi:hypothetical protein
VQLVRSLCIKVPALAWRVAGTGLRRAICWRRCVMRCTGFMGRALRVSSSPVILKSSLFTSSATYANSSSIFLHILMQNRCVSKFTIIHMKLSHEK